MPHSFFSFILSFSFPLHLLLLLLSLFPSPSLLRHHFHSTYLVCCDDHQSSSVISLSTITYLWVSLIPSALTFFSSWFPGHSPFSWYLTCLIRLAHLYINTHLFFFFIGHESSLPWYAPGTFRTTTCVIPVHLPHVSAERAQCPCPWFLFQRCLPDAGTSCTEVLRITTVQLRSLLLWACDHSRWCPALYELCKLEFFFFLLTEIWTNVLWHRNPAQYQLCQSDRGDDGRNNSGIHVQLHKCVLQLKNKGLRAWDLSHRSPAHYQLCQPDCGDDGRNNSGIHVQLHKCVLQ